MSLYEIRCFLKASPLAKPYALLRHLKRTVRPAAEPKGYQPLTGPDITALRQAIHERPQEPRLFFSLGIKQIEQNEPQSALDAFERCVNLGFEAGERLSLHAARALMLLGRRDEARKLAAGLANVDMTAEELLLRDEVLAVTQESISHA